MSKYAFGDIAINSTEKKKPEPVDKATYIGLEHLDSGCLTVRRFGADVAPIGDKLVMKKGDVLFGKRRAYQKKVAIAPFDGIFSAHGMVLRPKTEVIDKDFFPLFIASDYFLDAAIRISVGSLSPTINWSDLKVLEFSLPPLDEQRRLAQVLWAALDLKEAYQTMLARCDEMASSRFVEMFGDLTSNPFNWSFISLSDVCDVRDGTHDSPGYVASGYPLLTSKNFTSGRIDWSEVNYISKKDFEKIAQRSKVDFGDIVMPMIGTIGHPVIVDTKRDFAIKNVALIKFQNSLFSNMFIRTILESEYFKKVIADSNRGGTQKFISLGDIRKIRIPNVPIDLQNKFAAFIEQLDKSKVEVEKCRQTNCRFFRK